VLNNILEISRRKTHFWMNDNDKFWSFPVSLNINVRKNKSEEIFKENKKIADSLSKCKGTSDYSVKKLLAQADANDKRKNMITKKRKLLAIKKQMDNVKGVGAMKNVRFTDVINDAINKMKKGATSIDKLENEGLSLETVIEWIYNDLKVDRKITDFLYEIYKLAEILQDNISSDSVIEALDQTQ